MTSDQAIVFATLGAALVLFIDGRWRYDVVALLALLAVVLTDVVEPADAFRGFGHPAVIIVAAVIVVSRALMNAGIVDLIASRLTWVGDRVSVQVAAVAGIATLISGFVSSVGAAAILIPVAVRLARKSGHPPSLLLMPLAFGSLFGAQITLIGSAPNIIIATFREETGGSAFRMFDYTPVGLSVAVAGVLFVSLIGWRLLPRRKGQASPEELFDIQDYLSEVRIPEGAEAVGSSVREFVSSIEQEATIVGLVRGERGSPAPSGLEILRAGDVLIVEADSESLAALVDRAGLELVGGKELNVEALGSDEIGLMEAVVRPGSFIEGRTAINLNLRWRYGVNLLAVARQGTRLPERLSRIRFRAGDVLLLQGQTSTLRETLTSLGCLPLAERGLRIGQPRRVLSAVAIFFAALALAALGVLAAEVAFVAAAAAMILTGQVTMRESYESIDWSIIVLLGAMIPVGQALETTGGSRLIADRVFDVSGDLPAAVSVAILLAATMFLSDVVNNAAAAVLMAPIAIDLAGALDASADPFLMAVAVGASSAFLTPIGHQSNTLVMGPGGYRFGDYWRMGLPVEVLIALVALPLILIVWPL